MSLIHRSSEEVNATEHHITVGRVSLVGEEVLPPKALGLVMFAHGSGSSRHSPRNRMVAEVLNSHGIGTLLFDLLTPEEGEVDAMTAGLRFDLGFLADRLLGATHWVRARSETRNLPLGYFGASTGGGAALIAAAEAGPGVAAVVSRGGRPDLAAEALPKVQSPTLLIVGGLDLHVLKLNRWAFDQLSCPKELKVVPGATHLFVEPGALEKVADLATAWFERHLAR